MNQTPPRPSVARAAPAASSLPPWGVHWFRRDLRLHGNLALIHNLTRHAGRVVGLFCFDADFLGRPDFSANRFGFFLRTLESLQEDMRKAGGDLLVVDRGPDAAFSDLLAQQRQMGGTLPALVSWSRDYEPFARARDARLAKLLAGAGVPVHTDRDHLIIEPDEPTVLKPEGGAYQVYSPFARRWFAALRTPAVQERIAQADAPTPAFRTKWGEVAGEFASDRGALGRMGEANARKVTVPLPAAGVLAAQRRLAEFAPRLTAYRDERDLPARPGTSRLSIFLKNGSLTSAQVLRRLGLHKTPGTRKDGADQFVREIIWREFYYSILFHHPRVEREAFLPAFVHLQWENREDWFKLWCEGQTGFPIVDAGMRELATTGWMHNRVRMIVASFLTKDLLIDWRWGENHFMQFLLDGDLAPNNGGWQWAASTGCDPQPYFRIFNPWLQGQRFDPDAEYIRTFVPELRAAPVKLIHAPDGDRTPYGYPPPMVDHGLQKRRALALFGKY